MIVRDGNQKKESYINILKKCIDDQDYFDSDLFKYLLDYKKEYIVGNVFKSIGNGYVVHADLWGYIKLKEKNSDKLLKWSSLLEMDINNEGKYEYLKFSFFNYDLRGSIYNPFYFKENKEKNKGIEVSLNFLNIIGATENNNYKIEKLSENEMKLLFNELLYDNTIKYNNLDNKVGYINFFKDLQNFIVDHFEDMIKISDEMSVGNHILRLIANSSSRLLKEAFNSIDIKVLEKMFEKNNYEDSFLKYIKYKNVGTSFYVYALEGYKDKNFWKKYNKCEKDGNFSIINAIKPIIDLDDLEKRYENINQTIEKNPNCLMSNTIEYIVGDTLGYDDLKIKDIISVLNYYKEDIKNSKNYKEQLEKLIIFSITKNKKEWYKKIRNFIRDSIDSDLVFEGSWYKRLIKKNEKLLNEVKEEDINELRNKIENKLEVKYNKSVGLKI